MEINKRDLRKKITPLLVSLVMLSSAVSGELDKILLVFTFTVVLVLSYRWLGALVGILLILASILGGLYQEIATRLVLLTLGIYSLYIALKFEKFEMPPDIENLIRETEEKASDPV